MTQHFKPPVIQRNQRTARKLDRKKVLDLHLRGVSNQEIAQHQGVAASTVWRFLQTTDTERRALQAFKTGRADVFARLQAKSVDVQERIIDTLDDGVLNEMTASQKSSMLIALNAQSGTIYDKERLERGQSTSNQSIVSRLLDETVKNLYKPNLLRKQDGGAKK